MMALRSTVRIAGWRWRDGSNRETLANLSISGHLRCFLDQPVAEIVQCGEPAPKQLTVNNLRLGPICTIELPQAKCLILRLPLPPCTTVS